MNRYGCGFPPSALVAIGLRARGWLRNHRSSRTASNAATNRLSCPNRNSDLHCASGAVHVHKGRGLVLTLGLSPWVLFHLHLASCASFLASTVWCCVNSVEFTLFGVRWQRHRFGFKRSENIYNYRPIYGTKDTPSVVVTDDTYPKRCRRCRFAYSSATALQIVKGTKTFRLLCPIHFIFLPIGDWRSLGTTYPPTARGSLDVACRRPAG